MYMYFCLGGATQKLPRKQCTLPRAEGRDLEFGIRSFDSSVTSVVEILEMICRNEKYIFLYVVCNVLNFFLHLFK